MKRVARRVRRKSSASVSAAGVLDGMKDGVVEVLASEAKSFAKEAKQDAEAFVELMRSDLERWTRLAAAGELTRSDLEFLVAGNRDLAKMKALKRKGLAKARVDRMVDAMLKVVVDSLGSLL